MKYFNLILLSFIGLNTFSQDYRFGKVSEVELKEKICSIDSTANAAFLLKKKTVHYEFKKEEGLVQINEIHERIKIYNQEGYDYANKNIRLYDQSATNRQEVKGLRGYTYYLENGEMERTKLKNESIFDEKVNDYWALKKFTMPNINDGVIVEYEYRIESPFIRIDDIVLQEDVPIKKLEVEVKIPEYFGFNKTLNPKALIYPELKESKVERIENVYSRESKVVNGTTYNTSTNMSDIRFFEAKTEIFETNVPALIKEPMVDNINNYRSRLVLECVYIKSPNGSINDMSSTWDKVVQTIYEGESFGGQLSKTNYFEDDIDNLLSGITTEDEKIVLILDHVKSKVKWNDFVGYSTHKGVKSAYKEGEGNIGDINLMLVSMLRYAGVNANPVLVSTRSNGIPIVPTQNGFNYVIAAVEVSDGLIYLDATNPNSAPNIIPTHAINWQGRIVREHGSSTWVSLNSLQASKENVSINVKINDDLSIDGKVRNHLTNHLAFNFRERYNDLNKELHIQKIEEDKGDIEVSNLEIDGSNELSSPIMSSYDYHLENGIEEIGDKLYFTPMLFLAPDENPFKLEQRNYPIDIVYPQSEKYVVNIMLPDGYEVESLPENVKVQYNNTEGEFTYLARANGKMLQLTVMLDMNKTLILPENYKEFKKFFELVIEKETEKIVLKKV